jgi:hypothetical protein
MLFVQLVRAHWVVALACSLALSLSRAVSLRLSLALSLSLPLSSHSSSLTLDWCLLVCCTHTSAVQLVLNSRGKRGKMIENSAKI